MRIYTMTATFGKLEHETITFQPGLNVIHAPNEWGKSTWCAFICAMLYGIDTRERSKQGVIADKERYAPWSGSPMSGRMDIFWNGRDITIERHTRGRTPFGEFRAYETATGLPVPALTAANCGQTLLGVEKSVFTRSAFIRQADLPVGQDEALRRRLNALVTTGDETGASDDLAEKLKSLKNKCRHNKTGLLPQAEARRDHLCNTLTQLSQYKDQAKQLRTRQEDLDREIGALQNHKTTLLYQASQADRAQVDAAWEAAELARGELEMKQTQCASLPSRQEAQDQILNLEQLLLDQEALDAEPVPQKPELPVVPPVFSGLSPQAALDRAGQDKAAYDALSRKPGALLLIFAALLLPAGLAVGYFLNWLAALPFPVVSLLLIILDIRKRRVRQEKINTLTAKYPGISPDLWIPTAKGYAQSVHSYTQALADYQARTQKLNDRKDRLADIIAGCTGGLSIHQQINRLRDILRFHDVLQGARETAVAAENHARTLAGMVKPVAPPTQEDTLTLDQDETEAHLLRVQAERRELERKLGQVMGQMEALGSTEELERKLSATQIQIHRLEEIYSATVLAMETLSEASAVLQRKFAPRISRQAQAIFSRLTDGRYHRLQLDQELNLQTAATGEDHLREDLWRSDGTVDQLYLSLRLAVAAELTPEAPLILDDAFVRFDDTRLQRAMEVLKESAENQQVIVFSCQKREGNYL